MLSKEERKEVERLAGRISEARSKRALTSTDNSDEGLARWDAACREYTAAYDDLTRYRAMLGAVK